MHPPNTVNYLWYEHVRMLAPIVLQLQVVLDLLYANVYGRH